MIYLITNNEQLFQNPNIKNTTIEYLKNWLAKQIVIGFDTETTGFSAHTDNLLCYQFGDFNNQFVVDSGSFAINLFKDVFEDSSKIWILQNFKFDGRFLIKHGIDIWKMKIHDTFLAECILTTGLDVRGLALDDIVWKYCNFKLDKSIRGEINRIGLSSRVIKYAADDVVYLEKVMQKQLEEIEKYELTRVLILENQVVKVFTLMEYYGIKLDVPKWNDVIKTVNIETTTLENCLDEIVLTDSKFIEFRPKFTQLSMFDIVQDKTDINWASNQQKLAICRKIDSSLESVGDRELQKLKVKHHLIKTLIDYNKYKKLQSSFGKKFLEHVGPDGRIHPSIWQILSTGRISVSEPNLNQIPSKGELAKVIRSCFIPEQGYKIVGGDYSGMELRIIAEFSKDEVWLNAFKEGKDLHSVLCAMTFDIPIEDVKKETPFKKGVTYRDVQKTINFG